MSIDLRKLLKLLLCIPKLEAGRQACLPTIEMFRFFLPQYFFGMPRKKYRNVVCCVGQQKREPPQDCWTWYLNLGSKVFPQERSWRKKKRRRRIQAKSICCVSSNSFARNLFIFPTFKGESYWHHLNSKSGKEIETLDSEKKDLSTNGTSWQQFLFLFIYWLQFIYFGVVYLYVYFEKGGFQILLGKTRKVHAKMLYSNKCISSSVFFFPSSSIHSSFRWFRCQI